MLSRITETINSTIVDYKKTNQLDNLWKDPIIEVLPAELPEILALKEIISSTHFLPGDILPGAKSIVCFFIPFQENIIQSNLNGIMASEEWALAYVRTNDLIKSINDNIEALMIKNGYKAGKIKATHNFDVNKLISNWSHRHIACIAGIGTFGMNNMLITKNGCCGRIGSLILNYQFDDYKPVKKTNEKCLKKLNGSCGICQKKCVVNAYENNSFNRHKCYEHCKKNAEYHKKIGLVDICGKCLVGLPCSMKEPSQE